MISAVHGQAVQQSVVVSSEAPQIPETPSVSALLGSTAITHPPTCMPDTAEVTDEDKQAIYRHPLFPLMALLLEKCEQATASPDFPASESFDVDIQSFVRQTEQTGKPFFSDDQQLDALMIKAIQVLRIHLLELEKVNELCKDFCKRYIACLKGKLHSEHLLRNELGFDDEDFEIAGPIATNALSAPQPPAQQPNLVATVSGNSVVIHQTAPPVSTPATSGGGQTVYQMVQTPQGLVAQPIQVPNPAQQQQQQQQGQQQPQAPIAGSTPMSQIGAQAGHVLQTSSASPAVAPAMHPGMLSPEEDEDPSGKRSKRGVLPKQATQVMRSWLFQHIVHPYPSEDEKRQIAQQTNLTLLQVNNWFINARRRILQPMLDAGNPEQSKAKKSKPQTRPAQRFWPDSLANLQPQTGDQLAANAETTASSMEPVNEVSVESTTTLQPVTIQTGNNTQQILLPAGTIITSDGRIISGNSENQSDPQQVSLNNPTTVTHQQLHDSMLMDDKQQVASQIELDLQPSSQSLDDD